MTPLQPNSQQLEKQDGHQLSAGDNVSNGQSQRANHRSAGWLGRSPEWVLWLGLLSIVVLTCFARFRLAEMPFERDEGEYAYGAQLLKGDGVLYKDLHSMKWPGMYVAYHTIFKLMGETISSARWGLLFANLLSASLLYKISLQLINRTGAIVSAGAFLSMSILPQVHGFIANAEHFAVLCFLAGLNVAIVATRRLSLTLAVFAGLLAGTAPIMKQHAHVFVAATLLVILIEMIQQTGPKRISHFTKIIFGYLMGCVAVWALMLSLVYWWGAWDQFYVWTILYPSEYARQVSLGQAPANFVQGFMPFVLVSSPVLLLASIGSVRSIQNFTAQHQLSLLVLLAAGFAATVPGFYFREHYFLLAIPGIAMMAGVGSETILSWMSRSISCSKSESTGESPSANPDHVQVVQYAHRSGWMACLGAVIITNGLLSPLIQESRTLLSDSHEAVTKRLYGINPFVESAQIADYLKASLAEDERFGMLGSEPQLAFYSKRRLVSGAIYMYPLTEVHSRSRQMQEELMDSLTDAQPRIVVFVSTPTSWLMQPRTEQELFQWMPRFLKDYKMVAKMTIPSGGPTGEQATFVSAPSGEALKYWQATTPQNENYVAVFCREDSLSSPP